MVGWFYILNIWLDVLCKYNCMELNFCIGSNTTWWTNFWDGGWVCETCQSFLWEEMAHFCFPWFSSPRYSWTSISTSLYSRNKWVQTGSWYLIFSLFSIPIISYYTFPVLAEHICIALNGLRISLLILLSYYNLKPWNG